MMEYTKNLHDGSLNVALQGKFTFKDNPTFREILTSIEKEKVKALTIDIGSLEYVDSAALGMLLLARDMCADQGCALTLNNPRGQVAKMFDVSRFSQLFTIHNS